MELALAISPPPQSPLLQLQMCDAQPARLQKQSIHVLVMFLIFILAAGNILIR
jgi:hypothetical protein